MTSYACTGKTVDWFRRWHVSVALHGLVRVTRPRIKHKILLLVIAYKKTKIVSVVTNNTMDRKTFENMLCKIFGWIELAIWENRSLFCTSENGSKIAHSQYLIYRSIFNL